MDGGEWRHQRKLASYEFSTRALRDYSGTIFKKNATNLATAVSEAAATHMAMDIQVNPRTSFTSESWFLEMPVDGWLRGGPL